MKVQRIVRIFCSDLQIEIVKIFCTWLTNWNFLHYILHSLYTRVKSHVYICICISRFSLWMNFPSMPHFLAVKGKNKNENKKNIGKSLGSLTWAEGNLNYSQRAWHLYLHVYLYINLYTYIQTYIYIYFHVYNVRSVSLRPRSSSLKWRQHQQSRQNSITDDIIYI